MPTRADLQWRIPSLALGCALAAVPASAVAEAGIGGHVAATTDYVFRGVSQTRGAPALQADLHYETANGWFVGAWASTVDLEPGPGATLELNAYTGLSRPLGTAWGARFQAVHYDYPNDAPGRPYDYDEVSGTLSYRDRLAASVAWSPNMWLYSRYGPGWEGKVLTYDLVAQWPLAGPLSLSVGAGYQDLEDLVGTGYSYSNVGLAWALPRLQLDLGYYAASDHATQGFGVAKAGGRWSLTATWHFRGRIERFAPDPELTAD